MATFAEEKLSGPLAVNGIFGFDITPLDADCFEVETPSPSSAIRDIY